MPREYKSWSLDMVIHGFASKLSQGDLDDIDDLVNEHATDGWELVSQCFVTVNSNTGAGSIVFTFARELV